MALFFVGVALTGISGLFFVSDEWAGATLLLALGVVGFVAAAVEPPLRRTEIGRGDVDFQILRELREERARQEEPPWGC